MDHAIETHNLVKRFDRDGAPAVAGLDLTIPTGSVFGLIGGNGAGKTTTLRMLLGLLAPTAGTATVLGEDSRSLSKRARQRIGYLSEAEFPYDDLLFADVLKFVSGFFDTWDWSWCEHLLGRLKVDKFRRLDRMSKGQRRVAELLIAVAHAPDLLVLDDPAVGLDPEVRREVLWTLLEIAQERGTTVLFSSHILQDVERVVDRVGVLQAGTLRMCGELDEVKARVRRIVVPASLAPASVDGELHRETVGGEVVIVTERWESAMSTQLGEQVETMPLNLEEIYLAVSASSSRGRSVEAVR